MLKVQPKSTASLLTRDGIRLDADIYRPDAEGEFPVLLMRQPYGRAIASTVVYAHPTWYAAQGYIVVIQDVRGRGTSEGEFRLFCHETRDGADTVNWAASLPGSTGKVGMYGFSYQAMTQLYAATTKPAALKTICPAMMAYDLYADWAYEDGAFCWQTNLGWAMQLSAETARLKGDATAYQALYKASRSIPSHPEADLLAYLKKLAPAFYNQWLEHPQPDAYWENLSPKSAMQDVDLPILHIGGWFDTYLRGNIRLYKDIAPRSAYRQQLLIGPWTHLPWCRQAGTVDFGSEAINPVDQLQVRWFDQFLKDINTGLLEEAPVCLFEMGSNRWRNFASFPDSLHKMYFLSSTGLASIRDDDGILSTNKPENCLNDTFVHDPWRPVPALGGHAAIPAGCFERSHLDYRSDVLTYTTEALATDLHLAGEVTVEIWCNADKPSHDICAILSQVYPDGKSYNLTQGYLRVETSQNNLALQISLQATCVKITQGNALRLSISGACFPAYALNFGTSKTNASLIDAEIITLSVSCGGDRASRILLPMVAAS